LGGLSDRFVTPIELEIRAIQKKAKSIVNVALSPPINIRIQDSLNAGVLNPESWRNWGTEYMLLAIGIIGFFVVRRRYEVPEEKLLTDNSSQTT
jgi:hypothetical protein